MFSKNSFLWSKDFVLAKNKPEFRVQKGRNRLKLVSFMQKQVSQDEILLREL
jgi:hypothetical protein